MYSGFTDIKLKEDSGKWLDDLRGSGHRKEKWKEAGKMKET